MSTRTLTLKGRTFEIRKAEYIGGAPGRYPVMYTYYTVSENGERVIFGHPLTMKEVKDAIKALVDS